MSEVLSYASAAWNDRTYVLSTCGGLVPPCFGLYRMWAFILSPAFPEIAVGGFFDGTIAYSLSKTWHDLITAWLIPLHPRPFCEAEGCIMPASAAAQFRYAFLLLIPAAALKHFAGSRAWRHVPGIGTVPSMIGMLAGWGLGDACKQLFAELSAGRLADSCAAPPYDGAPNDCISLYFLFAGVLTALASVMVTHLQLFTKNIELGDGYWVDTLEDWLESVWQLLAKAVATSVMVVWTDALYQMVLSGTTPEQDGVRMHLFLFWAVASTLTGSLIAVKLQGWEARLHKELAAANEVVRQKVALQKAAATTSGLFASGSAPSVESSDTTNDVWKLDNLEGAVASIGESKHRKLKSLEISRLSALIEFSNLVQGTLGWVAGCAWTDVATAVFPTLSMQPTTEVFFSNLAVTLGLTLMSTACVSPSNARVAPSPHAAPSPLLSSSSCCQRPTDPTVPYCHQLSMLLLLPTAYCLLPAAGSWLVFLAQDSVTLNLDESGKVIDRESVEAYFLTGAMSFFVGWGWVLVIRDMFVPFGHFVGHLSDHFFSVHKTFFSVLGVSLNEAQLEYAGETVSVLLFAPLLTLAFFQVKHSTQKAYARAVGVRAKRRWQDAADDHADSVGSCSMVTFLQRNKMQVLVKRAAEQHGMDHQHLLSPPSAAASAATSHADMRPLLADQDKGSGDSTDLRA